MIDLQNAISCIHSIPIADFGCDGSSSATLISRRRSKRLLTLGKRDTESGCAVSPPRALNLKPNNGDLNVLCQVTTKRLMPVEQRCAADAFNLLLNDLSDVRNDGRKAAAHFECLVVP
jgi:hypothetical protein